MIPAAVTRPLVVLMLLVALPTAASAHRRGFVHTYEYQTVPAGDSEIEIWNTQSTSSFEDDALKTFEWQFEVEHGITDHWDVALYQVFRQTDGPADVVESFHMAMTKLETRYRFAERGAWPVDTLLYFEVAKEFGDSNWEIEPKVVLAKDVGASTVALNLIPELEVENEVEPSGQKELEVEFEPGWALGWSYDLSPRLRFGVENFGSISDPGGAGTVDVWAGPTFSWGPSPSTWVTANAAWGLNEHSDDFVVRFIIGLGL